MTLSCKRWKLGTPSQPCWHSWEIYKVTRARKNLLCALGELSPLYTKSTFGHLFLVIFQDRKFIHDLLKKRVLVEPFNHILDNVLTIWIGQTWQLAYLLVLGVHFATLLWLPLVLFRSEAWTGFVFAFAFAFTFIFGFSSAAKALCPETWRHSTRPCKTIAFLTRKFKFSSMRGCWRKLFLILEHGVNLLAPSNSKICKIGWERKCVKHICVLNEYGLWGQGSVSYSFGSNW